MTRSITPNNASNILVITVVWNGTNSSTGDLTVALFQDSTTDALAGVSSTINTAASVRAITFVHKMAAGTTSSTTFKVRAGMGSGGTTTFNGAGGSRLLGGIMASSITIQEIKA